MNYLVIKKALLFVGSLSLLASCGTETSSNEAIDTDPTPLKILSPKGAPALVLFTEGENTNWETKDDAKQVNAQLQNNEYDVIIAPVYGAMKAIKSFNCDFALARVVTGGNFYLVGVNKNAEDRPTSDSYIVGFAEQDVTGKAFKELYKNHWNLGDPTNVEWVDTAQNTLGLLKAGKKGDRQIDYILTAEPVFTNAKTQLDEGVTLTETYDIRKEWKDYANQDAMVQAGIFVRKSILNAKKSALKAFMMKIEENIVKATDSEKVQEVVDTLNAYNSVVTEQAKRFGYNANLVKALQSTNKNRFALVTKEMNIDVNAFLTKLGEEAYDSSYFVTIE